MRQHGRGLNNANKRFPCVLTETFLEENLGESTNVWNTARGQSKHEK
jgi:hypothetical protein